jgi:hypothetical protein
VAKIFKGRWAGGTPESTPRTTRSPLRARGVMPATDWREITFSRARLRPHDGLDPDVRPLRRKVTELAKKKQVPAYMQAKEMLEMAETKERAMKDKIRAEEYERQARERASLAEALKMRAASFDEEWAHEKKVMEDAVAEKRKGFEDRVEGQTIALELAIGKKAQQNMKLYKKSPHPPVIFSSTVRDDRQIESRQAQAGNFELAIRYNNSLKDQMQLEKKQHIDQCERILAQKRKVRESRVIMFLSLMASPYRHHS